MFLLEKNNMCCYAAPMCGITGFIDSSLNKSNAELMRIVEGMSAPLTHRGPDSAGTWVDAQTGVALAHQRLAIIDLSKEGAQPRVSHSERYVITYNGEIYNYLTLRKQLLELGCDFSGNTDTEVLLNAIDKWGLEKALHEINGMFAFALWDKKTNSIHLARDRIGEKPLYYGWAGEVFLFGSELKALKAHPSFVVEIDRDALALYTRHNYVPAPWSIYKGIFKLPPASCISIDIKSSRNKKPKIYWDIQKVAKEGALYPIDLSYEEAISKLDETLSNAVSERMMSDVPIGSFLSGGIDSSLVTALMQKQSTKPIKSFCIGFEDAGYDEAKAAKKIANHIGTEHEEFYVTAEEARNVIPDLPHIYDEPFADPSQIPTYHVSRLAKQHVTVALSGDGGDEGFAGYSRYDLTKGLSEGVMKTPQIIRTILHKTLKNAPLRGRAHKLLQVLAASDDDQLYKLMMSYWKAPEQLVIDAKEPFYAMNDPKHKAGFANFANHMMYTDMVNYLPDNILCKLDRASMAVSLETRVPLLDYKVIELAWQLPLSMKTKNGEGKRILRSLLENYVPKPLFDRPKQGFGIPHGQWLRGPLREWAESLINENKIKQEGFFNSDIIQKKWREHLSGTHDWGYQIWGILMFQAWYNKQKKD